MTFIIHLAFICKIHLLNIYRCISFHTTITLLVSYVHKGKPDIPRNITVTCKETGTIDQWISSFNGGDTQNFTVITLSGQDGTSLYIGLNDKGENEIHVTYLSNLQPSVTYWFFVSAKNSHGSSLSKAISCTTVKCFFLTFVNTTCVVWSFKNMNFTFLNS